MTLTGPARSALEQEITQLTQGMKPEHAGALAASVRRNVANWQERLAEDPIGTKWQLLDAYVARITVAEDPSSPFHAERMAFARAVCRRLVAESGLAYVAADPVRVRILALFDPQAAKDAVTLHRPKAVRSAA